MSEEPTANETQKQDKKSIAIRGWRGVNSVIIFVAMTACQMVVEPTTKPTANILPSVAPISTRIPLSHINLDGILIKDNDLPSILSAGPLNYYQPVAALLLGAKLVVTQTFFMDGDDTGEVIVFLHETDEQVRAGYEVIVIGFEEHSTVTEVGEIASFVGDHFSTIDEILYGDIIFVRCHAVVHISFTNTNNRDELIAYAKRLDARLSELVCD